MTHPLQSALEKFAGGDSEDELDEQFARDMLTLVYVHMAAAARSGGTAMSCEASFLAGVHLGLNLARIRAESSASQ